MTNFSTSRHIAEHRLASFGVDVTFMCRCLGYCRNVEVELTGKWQVRDRNGAKGLYVEVKWYTAHTHMVKEHSWWWNLWFRQNTYETVKIGNTQFVNIGDLDIQINYPIQECASGLQAK